MARLAQQAEKTPSHFSGDTLDLKARLQSQLRTLSPDMLAALMIAVEQPGSVPGLNLDPDTTQVLRELLGEIGK